MKSSSFKQWRVKAVLVTSNQWLRAWLGSCLTLFHRSDAEDWSSDTEERSLVDYLDLLRMNKLLTVHLPGLLPTRSPIIPVVTFPATVVVRLSTQLVPNRLPTHTSIHARFRSFAAATFVCILQSWFQMTGGNLSCCEYNIFWLDQKQWLYWLRSLCSRSPVPGQLWRFVALWYLKLCWTPFIVSLFKHW